MTPTSTRSPAAQGPGDRVGAHVVDHLRVDALRRAAQREFAQRGQIARREIMADGPLRLVRHIDLAFLQALDQIVRRQVDQLDVVGAIDDRIRHRLADPDPGDPGDDVVQAFDVLDVQRRIDIDAGAEQLLDIHVAFRMPAARRIGVGKLVDQHQLRPAGEDGVEVHLFEPVTLVLDAPARDDFETVEQRLGLLAAMRLDDADDDVDAFAALRLSGLQHLDTSCRRRARRRGRS